MFAAPRLSYKSFFFQLCENVVALGCLPVITADGSHYKDHVLSVSMRGAESLADLNFCIIQNNIQQSSISQSSAVF